MVNNKFLLLISLVVCCQASFKQPLRFKNMVTNKLMIDRIQMNNEDVMLKFKKAARCKGYEPMMPADEFMHIYTLTKMNKVAQMITQKTGFLRANSSSSIVLHWLSAGLLTVNSENQAQQFWRSIEAKISDYSSWQEQKKLFEVPRVTIHELYQQAKQFNAIADDTLIDDVVDRIYGDGVYTHKFCDDNQMMQEVHPLRNLEAVTQNGLLISLQPDRVNFVKKMFKDTKVPMVEALKNHRFLTICDLKNSKISQLIHDYFDHFWTFSTLKEDGIFDRYKPFLNQVGNPQLTDIFSREGELIASIAYDFRYTNLPYFKHISFLGYDQISDILRSSTNKSSNQQRALNILAAQKTNENYQECLPVVVCGVYTEIMQQRVKNGVIKMLDHNRIPVDVLHILHPEYLALMVETYDCLYRNKEQGFKELLNMQMLVEEYLTNVASESKPALSTVISDETVKNYNINKTFINPHKVSWFTRNLNAVSDRTSYN